MTSLDIYTSRSRFTVIAFYGLIMSATEKTKRLNDLSVDSYHAEMIMPVTHLCVFRWIATGSCQTSVNHALWLYTEQLVNEDRLVWGRLQQWLPRWDYY